MNLNIAISDTVELKPRIVVFGVGGAGGNAVNNMIAQNLEGVDFVAANTDAQALALSRADKQVQIGRAITQGLGAGARPEIGRAAAEESLQEITDHLTGCHMCFIAAGMGGGTGTGAAPVIARIAKELDILTVGVVTKPFHFEGNRRMNLAEQGLEELQQYVDTLIIIPNQNLFRIAGPQTTFVQAFAMADEVLQSGVRGITDLMVMPGLINLDFADVRSVMSEMGKAMMGTGEAEGEDRAREAAERAISNPLLDDVSMKGARGVLINITGGMDLTLMEVDEAANRIRSEVDPDANIIVGSTLSDTMNGAMRVSIVATGIDADLVTHGDARETLRANAVSQQPITRAPPRAAQAPAPQVPTARAPAAPAMRAPAKPSTDILDDLPDVDGIEEDIADVSPVPARDVIAEMAESRKDRTFVAPPAARAPSAPKVAERSPVQPAEPESRRVPGLIERMTGSSWLRRDPAPLPDPKPQAAPESSSAPAASQSDEPTLRTTPQDKLFLGGDDDQLEIPAFLRRQAN